MRCLLFNTIDRASAGLHSGSTPEEIRHAVELVYESHLVAATVYAPYQSVATTDAAKLTLVEDLEVMVKTTCELGSHHQRLYEDRNPSELLHEIEDYQTNAGMFPSMVRKVISVAPVGLVTFLVTNQKSLVSRVLDQPANVLVEESENLLHSCAATMKLAVKEIFEMDRLQLAAVDYQKAVLFTKEKPVPAFSIYRYCFKSKLLTVRMVQNFNLIRGHVCSIRQAGYTV